MLCPDMLYTAAGLRDTNEGVNKGRQKVKLVSQLHLIQAERKASVKFVHLYSLVVFCSDKDSTQLLQQLRVCLNTNVGF